MIVRKVEKEENQHGPLLRLSHRTTDREDRRLVARGEWSQTSLVLTNEKKPVAKSNLLENGAATTGNNGESEEARWMGPRPREGTSVAASPGGALSVSSIRRTTTTTYGNAVTKNNRPIVPASSAATAAAAAADEEQDEASIPRILRARPSIHPRVEFQSLRVGSIDTDHGGLYDTNDADRWASRLVVRSKKEGGGEGEGGEDGEDGEEDGGGMSKIEIEMYLDQQERLKKERKLISHINVKFGNPKRVIALAKDDEESARSRLLQQQQRSRRRGAAGAAGSAAGHQETRAIGYHGGDPPYFSKTVFPMSELQEPSLHSTKKMKVVIDAPIEKYQRTLIEKENQQKKIEEMTRDETDDALRYEVDEVRYHGLVPVAGLLAMPKKKILKQIDRKWLKEVSDERNRPNVNDLEYPIASMVDVLDRGTESGGGGGGGRRRGETSDAYMNRNMVECGRPLILPKEKWTNMKKELNRTTSQTFASYRL